MTESGAVVGLTLVTTRSDILRGNFSASLKLVSNINWSMKLERPMDASRSTKSSSSNLSGSVQEPVKAPVSISSCSCGAISPSYWESFLGYLAGQTKGRYERSASLR